MSWFRRPDPTEPAVKPRAPCSPDLRESVVTTLRNRIGRLPPEPQLTTAELFIEADRLIEGLAPLVASNAERTLDIIAQRIREWEEVLAGDVEAVRDRIAVRLPVPPVSLRLNYWTDRYTPRLGLTVEPQRAGEELRRTS